MREGGRRDPGEVWSPKSIHLTSTSNVFCVGVNKQPAWGWKSEVKSWVESPFGGSAIDFPQRVCVEWMMAFSLGRMKKKKNQLR